MMDIPLEPAAEPAQNNTTQYTPLTFCNFFVSHGQRHSGGTWGEIRKEGGKGGGVGKI